MAPEISESSPKSSTNSHPSNQEWPTTAVSQNPPAPPSHPGARPARPETSPTSSQNRRGSPSEQPPKIHHPLPSTYAHTIPHPPRPPPSPRTRRLRMQIDQLQLTHRSLTTELCTSRSKLRHPDASATVQRHITLLHRYNEIKDIGLGLMGLIADQRGVRLKEVMREWGVDEKD